jgi:predicted adenylyl cyclase CyaB
MSIETETKFKIDSPASMKKRLKTIGAKFLSKNIEKDIYYRPQSCHKAGFISRFRTIGNEGIFTIKDSLGKRLRKSGAFKIRNELEVKVADAEKFEKMLRILGFKPMFCKEKIREIYSWKNAKITIDELPLIGCYSEIEGPRSRIIEAASLLGLDMQKAIPDTYMELLADYRKRSAHAKILK